MGTAVTAGAAAGTVVAAGAADGVSVAAINRSSDGRAVGDGVAAGVETALAIGLAGIGGTVRATGGFGATGRFVAGVGTGGVADILGDEGGVVGTAGAAPITRTSSAGNGWGAAGRETIPKANNNPTRCKPATASTAPPRRQPFGRTGSGKR